MVTGLAPGSQSTRCVLLAERISAVMSGSPGTSRLANRIGGGILIALGINLAATR